MYTPYPLEYLIYHFFEEEVDPLRDFILLDSNIDFAA